jgi:hypothetical protein
MHAPRCPGCCPSSTLWVPSAAAHKLRQVLQWRVILLQRRPLQRSSCIASSTLNYVILQGQLQRAGKGKSVKRGRMHDEVRVSLQPCRGRVTACKHACEQAPSGRGHSRRG